MWLLTFLLKDNIVFALYHLQILYSCIDHIHFKIGLKNNVKNSVVWLLTFPLEDNSTFALCHLQIFYSCIDHIHFEMCLKNNAMYNLWYFQSILASYIVVSFCLVVLSNCFSTWAILEECHHHLLDHPTIVTP